MKFTTIIGLEVHIELATQSKMFCGCNADHFGKPPNSQTCPVCLGLPGALPVANKKAVEWTILTGLALNCQIAHLSKFDRKNYYYPDLPKGYQISQYDLPLCTNGKLQKIRLRRIHLEEDTGKLLHTAWASLIDFNRSGVPLMEIVTEPDIKSAAEAKEFLQKLQQIVRYLGVSEADMEKGQMRCEPTVNLKVEEGRKVSFTPLVEIKNINSFRFVCQAIDFEIQRQAREFERTKEEKRPGNKTTRGWDEVRKQTILQREKEEAADYRYFPEPDLPPMRLRDQEIKILKERLPELPDEKIKRLRAQYGLTEYQAKILAETRAKADDFEKICRSRPDFPGIKIANLIINKKENLAKILTPKKTVVGEKDLEKIISAILKSYPQAVGDYRKGKINALEFLLGQAMAQTKGQADANLVRKILKEKLSHG